MRGAKPKPSALKLFEGNRGKRKLNLNEPTPDPLGPDLPPELEGDAPAVAEWQRTIVPAIFRKQITTADRTLAVAHCTLWSTWLSQVEDAAKHPHVVGVKGRPTANPARGMANKTLLLLVRVDAELGLTPSSRSRVTVASEKEYGQPKDKWAGLL